MSKRRPNWITAEILKLVQSCTSLLTGSAKPCDRFWREVTEMVNSVGGQERSDEEVSRKWTDLKSQTKIKERKNRSLAKGTGGGPPPRPLVDWEEMIINAMPAEAIEGLVGGTDTFCDLGHQFVKNSKTSKQKIDMKMSDEQPGPSTGKHSSAESDEQPGPSTGVFTEEYTVEESTKGKVKTAKRKVQQTSAQERILEIEEKKLKIEEERLQLEKEKTETLKKMSENILKIYVLLKHKIIEDDVMLQFLEQ